MDQHEQIEEAHWLTPDEVAQIEARKEAALSAALKTPGTCTVHLRLSIDFHIIITGTPPDDDGLNEPDPLYHARQARLLSAVKSNPTVLKQWMESLIVGQMQQKGWSYWEQLTGGEVALQDILTPALAALSEGDQTYFAEVATGEYFDDAINLFAASFVVNEDNPMIQENFAP
jgi:hypothetical protein